MKPFTILHTSDWHLGNKLYSKKRDDEFSAFLAWIREELRKNEVDALIVAGDIFDTGAPSAQAQKMYYSFLASLGATGVRHVVIVGGNHDSPSFLSAADEVLRGLNVYVVSAKTDDPEDEVIVLRDPSGEAELIVCGAPFLRERDLRELKPGETAEERNASIINGLREHYSRVADLARAKREESGREIPVVATGHLFAGPVDPESLETERDLYVGNLGRAPIDIFPDDFDYVALGHIHKASSVDDRGRVRYSGSPLPMSFREALYRKEVVLSRWFGREAEISSIPVPSFRKMLTLRGDSAYIKDRVSELAKEHKRSGEELWLEIFHEGADSTPDLREECIERARGSNIEICCVVPPRRTGDGGVFDDEREIDEIDPEEMFVRRMDAVEWPQNDREELIDAFRELLADYTRKTTGVQE